ncbi:DUF1972 domain-containing protein [Kocuria flava]|uniref:DUF1972 domain-containing protein n=1 Tax=Kocuria flava TaxID=446860 RepID=UPI002F9241FD
MSHKVGILGTRGYPSYYGGFETAVRKLAPFLADNNWNVTVYGRHGSTKQDDKGVDIRVNRVDTFGLEYKSLSTLSYGFSSTLHAIFNRVEVALVMNCANGFWLPLLKLAGIPSVVNVDGMEWERAKWGNFAKRVFKIGARMTARYADYIIADSHEIARRWKMEFGRTSNFIPYGGEPESGISQDSLYPTQSYILVVARFVPENSIPEFFEAVRHLDGRYPVVIVGSSGYGGSLDKAAAELASTYENVSWLGHLADDEQLAALWRNAGAYFHGHSVGGTNPALVQAMACGAPIVARDTPYNREVLASYAEFVGNTPDEIAAALSGKIQNVQKGNFVASAQLERVKEIYNWPSVCAKYEQLLARAITGGGKQRLKVWR